MSVLTATAELDLSALANNIKAIKKLAPNSKMLAVLKANAYGHGLVGIAKILTQQTDASACVDAFGVARIEEALELRKNGINTPIVLLEGFFSTGDLPLLVEHNLQTIVHNQAQLEALCQAEHLAEQSISVWLKIDTGMHRLGISPDEVSYYQQALKNASVVKDELIFISHLSSADELDNVATGQQIALFAQLTQGMAGQCSLANSAGTLAWPQAHFDWIRPGLMMYGINPMAQRKESSPETDQAPKKAHEPIMALPTDIQPVMTLKSSIIALRTIKAGDAVGYSGTWVSDKDTTIAVVAIGYGDGYPRHAQNGTPVLVNGRRVPLVGRVSMDMITIDLGANAQEKIGDLVTLWGKELAIEEVAQWATTIPYELLCNISQRVHLREV